MQKNELKKEIDTLIDSIKKQADRMNLENNFSKVELEVFHHKIQKLYEKSILIHNLPATDENNSPPAERITVASPVSESPPPAAPVPKPLAAEVEKKPEAAAPEKPVIQSKVPGDLFGTVPVPENRPLSKPRTEKESPAKTIRKPIPDLKTAISINDKFRYINELFDGNATEFNIALNQINSCPGFEDADIYVSNIRDIYKWPDDKEEVGMFLELVERRFL
ncbi:MAG TPA: hypothetical protein VGO45_13955 [Bacteroidia bacterium]|jgi:hypothetical protein|nr:hypothetical protein [Bacteroidia bacterium]